MICPVCGTELPDDATACSVCDWHMDEIDDADDVDYGGEHVVGHVGEHENRLDDGGEHVAEHVDEHENLPYDDGEHESLPDYGQMASVEPYKRGVRDELYGVEHQPVLTPIGEFDDQVYDSFNDDWVGVSPEVAPASVLDVEGPHNRGYKNKLAIVLAAIVAVIVCINLIAYFATLGYKIDESTFPDPGVRAAVAAADTNGDGEISREEADSLTQITIDGATNISGLGIFGNLESVLATGENLQDFDITDAKSVKTVDLSQTKVATVEVSGLPNLESLNLRSTGISEIDVSGCGSLAYLDVQGTALQSIDVSGSSALANLRCDDSVTVSGLDSTELSQYWVVSDYAVSEVENGQVKSTTSHVVPVYNSSNLLESVTYSDGSDNGTAVYSYDGNDNLSQMVVMDGDDAVAGWRFSFNGSGTLARAIDEVSGTAFTYHYLASGALSTYSSSGSVTSVKGTSSSSSSRRTGISSSSSRLSSSSKSFQYGAGDRVESISGSSPATLTYDAGGRLTTYATEDGNNISTFQYDGSGRCIGISRQIDGKGIYNEVFEYDENGALVRASRTLGEGVSARSYPLEAATVNFTVDANGNIVKAVYEGDGDTQVVVDIAYRRILANAENAPVGVAPVFGDPIDIKDPATLYWAPWLIDGETFDYEMPVMLVFNPNQALFGTSNPLGRGNIPEVTRGNVSEGTSSQLLDGQQEQVLGDTDLDRQIAMFAAAAKAKADANAVSVPDGWYDQGDADADDGQGDEPGASTAGASSTTAEQGSESAAGESGSSQGGGSSSGGGGQPSQGGSGTSSQSGESGGSGGGESGGSSGSESGGGASESTESLGE